mmetsp:Transcript_24804/g.54060  ORF Transcript_24804/g.54060 Transcript_24804/m.54060 type:complete len:132 (+) Transcript_24804:185-580(+)
MQKDLLNAAHNHVSRCKHCHHGMVAQLAHHKAPNTTAGIDSQCMDQTPKLHVGYQSVGTNLQLSAHIKVQPACPELLLNVPFEGPYRPDQCQSGSAPTLLHALSCLLMTGAVSPPGLPAPSSSSFGRHICC